MWKDALASARAATKIRSYLEHIAATVCTRKLVSKDVAAAWVAHHCGEFWPLADVERVVARCVAEANEDRFSSLIPRSEPLRWPTHGRPGVGKSKVIHKIIFSKTA